MVGPRTRAPLPAGAANERRFDDPDLVSRYERATGELFDEERAALDRLLRPTNRVLDLGVGAGRTTGPLVDVVGRERYIGIDLAPAMVEAARRAHPGVDLRVGDASDLSDIPDASIDLVLFSYNGLDYVFPRDRRRRCIAEVRRVLAPGGTFVFSGHAARALVRPPSGEGRTARRVLLSVWASLRLTLRSVMSAAFWTGAGYRRDVDRRLTTYVASPRRVLAEVGEEGFQHVVTLPADHPRRRPRFAVRWWLYAFRAP